MKYFYFMFVRKKKNRSGSTSVIVTDKSCGRFKELATIGVSSDPKIIEELVEKGHKWIDTHLGIRNIFDEAEQEREERQVVDYLLSNVEQILLNGPQLILDEVYKKVGFDAIKDDILKQLVIARISQPSSKAGTVEYLKSHFDEDLELQQIYRYLDKLHRTQQELVQEISVAHTRKILGGNIGLVFYDVTTLYFETDLDDELRNKGWSKDGKHSQPQVVLGLLVSRDGYPLSYSLFNGSQYEGRTMIPVVEDFVKRFKLDDFVVVADAGLMNKRNIELLESAGYKYIIGAKIKSESDEMKQWIFSLEKQDGLYHETKRDRGRLIVGYSEKRAKKDVYNRNKGVKRLRKEYQSGTISKDKVNKRGYNKFLKLSSNISVEINEEMILEDAKWDGLKGYITNTDLPAKEVCRQYNGLWVVERAYRVTKGNLEMRPIFHFTAKRIEAHICICFVAYKVYKELERILKLSGIELSVDKVLNIAKTITTMKIRLPNCRETMTKTMLLTEKHKSIDKLFDPDFWKSV